MLWRRVRELTTAEPPVPLVAINRSRGTLGVQTTTKFLPIIMIISPVEAALASAVLSEKLILSLKSLPVIPLLLLIPLLLVTFITVKRCKGGWEAITLFSRSL